MNTFLSGGQSITRRGQMVVSSSFLSLAIVTFPKGKRKKFAVDNLLNDLFRQFVK